jgi:hypothetical protein
MDDLPVSHSQFFHHKILFTGKKHMKMRLRSTFISLVLSILLFASILFLGFIYLIEPGPEGKANYIYSATRLFLHKYAIIDKLTPKETKKLYKSTCTRQCHSTNIIEKSPRTAMEWEGIVTRMRISEGADITEKEANVITGYLQENFLSRVPTILPEKIMRFLKRHLWRTDFGESDIYLDLIFIPRLHRNWIPYLVINSPPGNSKDSLFILFINTHRGEIPPWNLAEMVTLRDNQGLALNASNWQVTYEDGQNHHRQGLLSFPGTIEEDSKGAKSMEVVIKLPGMREKVFQWELPIPAFTEKD